MESASNNQLPPEQSTNFTCNCISVNPLSYSVGSTLISTIEDVLCWRAGFEPLLYSSAGGQEKACHAKSTYCSWKFIHFIDQ